MYNIIYAKNMSDAVKIINNIDEPDDKYRIINSSSALRGYRANNIYYDDAIVDDNILNELKVICDNTITSWSEIKNKNNKKNMIVELL